MTAGRKPNRFPLSDTFSFYSSKGSVHESIADVTTGLILDELIGQKRETQVIKHAGSGAPKVRALPADPTLQNKGVLSITIFKHNNSQKNLTRIIQAGKGYNDEMDAGSETNLFVNEAELASGSVGGRAEMRVEHQIVHQAAGLVVRDASDRVRVHVTS